MTRGSAQDRQGRTARLMLLLATLFGLAAMHTLGHHGPHLATGHHSSHSAAMTETPVGVAVDDVVGTADDCGADSCGVILAAPMTGGHAMADWDVCVAVLVAFVVLLLVAVLVRGRRAATTAHRAGLFSSARPRGPPGRPVGLTFATVSVLRT